MSTRQVRFIPSLAVCLLCCVGEAVELRGWIELSPDYQGDGIELIISWSAELGRSYNAEAATKVAGPWSALNPQPIVAQSATETFRDQSTEPIRFYRVGEIVPPWSKTFGGSNWDYAFSVQQTSDGGYIVAGFTESFGAGGQDAWLIKTDACGIEQWSRTFGGAGQDTGKSVQQTSDGGYIVAGLTSGFPGGGLIKTDGQGNREWSRTYAGLKYTIAYSARQSPDGGYVVAGSTHNDSVDPSVWLMKTDAGGNQQWSRTLGGYEAYSVRETSDGGYILAGLTTENMGTRGPDALLIKTDASGREQWSRTFGGTGRAYDKVYSAQQTSDGGYILAGSTWGDAWLIKTDASGKEEWSRTFGRGMAFSVQQTSDGGYIVAGEYIFGTDDYDALLIKTDAEGNEQWTRTFGGTGMEQASSVQQSSDGGYVLAGGVRPSFGVAQGDAWVIKTDPQGNAPLPQ